MAVLDARDLSDRSIDDRAGSGLQVVEYTSHKEAVPSVPPTYPLPPPPPTYFSYGGDERHFSRDENGYAIEKRLPRLPPREMPAEVTQKKSRRGRWAIVIAVVIVIILVVTIPTAVVLSRRASSGSRAATSSPAVNERIPSTQGAFNGTGLTCIPPLHPVNSDALWLFWQDFSGDVKLSSMSNAGVWGPGESLQLENVANGTGLASLTHLTGEGLRTSINHLVYVTRDFYLADLIFFNGTGPWRDGGLHDLRLLTPGAPLAEAPSQLAFLAGPGATSYVYFAGSNGFVSEIAYDHDAGRWGGRYVFEGSNGFGGLVPQSFAPDRRVTNLYVLTPEEDFGMFWRDTGESETWNAGATAQGSIYPNSSMTVPVEGEDTDLVFFLLDNEDESGRGAEVATRRISGETSDARWMETTPTGIRALPGSALFSMVRRLPSGSGRFETQLFFQSGGDDIQHYAGTGSDLSRLGEIPVS